MNYSNHIAPKKTPVTRPIFGEKMGKNNGGGYAYTIDSMKKVRRFLILGTEGGTFYQKESTLTIDQCENIIGLINSGKGIKVLELVKDVSHTGIAKKNTPAIFVLSLLLTYGDDETKKKAAEEMPSICRTGTHLFILASYVKSLRGWGTIIKKMFTAWYNGKDDKSLAYQITKYKSRITDEGISSSSWSHRDLLRLNHIKPTSELRGIIYKYITDPDKIEDSKFKDTDASIIWAAKKASTSEDINEIISLISEYKLSREMVNTKFLSDKKVQKALLENGMGLTALIRNLASFTASGLISDYDPVLVNGICDRITNKEELKKARIHPLSVLEALKTYQRGKGFKGNLNWEPNVLILEALNRAFYECFNFIEPTGKTIYLGMDVSSSTHTLMTGSNILMVNEVIAVTAMILARIEKNYILKAFSDRLVDIRILPTDSFETVVNKLENIPFGWTDCSIPMIDAMEKKANIDAFVILTDNETNAGVHPSQAIKEYRKIMNKPDCKMVIAGMAPCDFTIANPDDINSLDVVGGSTETVTTIMEFISGKI